MSDDYRRVSSSVAYGTADRPTRNLRRWGVLLGGCLGLLALVALCVVGALVLGGNILKSSDVAQQALATARADPTVQAELGTPVEVGWFVTGSISTQGLLGDADLVIPISGPKKSGTLYASARRQNGEWHYYTLAVQVDGRAGVIALQP